MAVSPSPSATLDPKPEKPDTEMPLSSTIPSSTVAENPNPLISPSLPSIQSFSPSPVSAAAASIPPPSAPSFRPISAPAPATLPALSPLIPNPNFQYPNFQNPNLQPPGVTPVSIMLPGVATGAGAVTVSVSSRRPAGIYHVAGSQPPNAAPVAAAMNPYAQAPNGYLIAPGMAIPPPDWRREFAKSEDVDNFGVPRYPMPYPGMVRPAFPPRPPAAIGVIPPLSRPPVPNVRGIPPIVTPVVRPVIPIVAPTEKPQTTVYIGKIAPTVENDFLLSLLRLCGPVKSWKRAQDPSDGSPRGFGFCEFESAEGVLRALRLLSKFNVDGQELVLNVNQATREYLERYVEKKTEREKKLKEDGTVGDEKEGESAPGVEKHETPKPSIEDSKEDGSLDKENQDATQKFGIVTDEDREADKDASEKLKTLMEERMKTKPPPPPPPMQNPVDGSTKSNSEVPAKSRDADSDVDIMKSDAAEDKNDDETTSEIKPTTEHDRPETSSSDKGRKYDRRSRDRDRERDLKREKERELERYERERERERLRRERDREMKIREAERLYKERVKEWESREREKEYQRMYDKEREKERDRERWREIMDQEDESDDDDTRKRRRRSSAYEEKRKKRLREMEEDLADRLREEEEFAEAKRRAVEDQQRQKDDPKFMFGLVKNGNENSMILEEGDSIENRQNDIDKAHGSDSDHANHVGDAVSRNDNGDDISMGSSAVLDTQNSNAPARKLGFGLVGSGKRTTVPSVFHEEDDEDPDKEKKMRPLVPIDYSTDELQAIQATASAAPPNLVAAAEFAKRISNVNPKDERLESESERRSRRSNERSSQRDRERNGEENNRTRDENRGKVHDKTLDREHGPDKMKIPENKKLLDAKQLIDMIPKTKEELFAYDINWAVYDKHELHERMKPWISKKITEFLGEEEATLVDYIVSSTKDHVRASQMLELLQSILDDEAEMFVLKMWRMLIFEIKKVETGLSLKPRV